MVIIWSKALHDLDCIFIVSGNGTLETASPAKYYEMCEKDRQYGGYIFPCAEPDVVNKPPCFVQILERNSKMTSVRLRLSTLQKIAPFVSETSRSVFRRYLAPLSCGGSSSLWRSPASLAILSSSSTTSILPRRCG